MASTQERDEREHVTEDTSTRIGDDLARTLEQAARDLLERGEEEGVEHTLALVVRGAIQTVPHVEQAGISLVEEGRRVEAHVPSDDVVRRIDELQNELGEGPCLDSIWYEQRTVIDDMSEAEHRWPRYAKAAQDLGIGSLMSFQLFAQRGSAGALNLYASRPHVFDESTTDAGRLFAAQAALVLHGAQRIQGLHTALESRDVIGQAKGILMERFGVGQAQAFSMLVESSQNTNMKLVKVAEWLTGEAEKKGRSGNR
ncbi:GAF and ANTAR domain-containing protein [Actinomycetospora straminea]|uniref:GAF and ANTAR domain-containing protein n=1 Tax=Actinomycetospora straminea TaxID=663607 RepID=A0ABP9EI88_9PSEU|nr:GAF and ANTAR domain-containing protein [Actinomycetospora straminea]MDD7936707.1 GAF and ANTAR domain-containing protein [Actinomycetospora straminea]